MYKLRSSASNATGFTLVELMIAIAIIGILASVAYPSYQDSVRQGRRIDAKNTLLGLQLEVEKRRAGNTTYATDVTTLPAIAQGGGYVSLDGFYTITYDAADQTTWQITATPIGDQANDACGAFVIDENGPDTVDPADRACWGM